MTRWAAGLSAAALAWVPAAHGQAVVDRTPNLADGWAVRPGVVQFNFVHRFEVSPPPTRKVSSFPTFHLASGLPYRFQIAVNYATNSSVFADIPNEYEITLGRALTRQTGPARVDAALTGGYNFAAQSVDADLQLARGFGRLRLLGSVRGISSGYEGGRTLWGAGGGAVVRVTSWLSLAGDGFKLANSDSADRASAAWGAGVQLRIPYSPHSLSLQVTNTNTATIEGASRGIKGEAMLGFEFTIPFTLSRYFGGRAARPPRTAPAGPARPGAASSAVRVANFAFGTGELRVPAGTRVRWTNADQVEHTVTAEDGSFESGLIAPGASYEQVFANPGTYPYHCTPHPFMHATLIVTPAPAR